MSNQGKTYFFNICQHWTYLYPLIEEEVEEVHASIVQTLAALACEEP